MKIIKLNAIDSTNSFLKDLVRNSFVENFTTVVTENQKNGKGQMHTSWQSEPFKNLTFSTLISKVNLKITESKYINYAVSLAVYEALKEYTTPNLSIKWPNDIMSDDKKVCGILIENTFHSKRIKHCIVGIGLNVNQENFENLPNAASLKNLLGKNFSIEEILKLILEKLYENFKILNANKFNQLEKDYLQALYKKGLVSNFKDKEGNLFSGIICGISTNGYLQIKLNDNSLKEFGIKEITFC